MNLDDEDLESGIRNPSFELPPGYCDCGDPIDGDDPERCETCRMLYGVVEDES